MKQKHRFANNVVSPEDAGLHGGIYRVTCSCGWVSINTYGGNYPRDGEENTEMLEKILHLLEVLTEAK